MKRGPDITGRRFGLLQVLGLSHNKNGTLFWRCLCDCGTEKPIRTGDLTSGRTISCSCYGKTAVLVHGGTGTPEHNVWMGMIVRCHTPTYRAFKNYGGRGITVCDEWRASFTEFLAHVGRRPSPAHTIERIRNGEGYKPGNVKWATRAEQGRNRRTTKLTQADVDAIRAADGPLKQIAEKYGVAANHVSGIRAGKSWAAPTA